MIVLPEILTADEIRLAREFLGSAPFEVGRLTASGSAAERKNNLQAARSRDPEGLAALDQMIVAVLERHPLFTRYTWPRRVTAPVYGRYEPGMRYGAHVDGPLMGLERKLRTDVSLTVFLSEPAKYEGGEQRRGATASENARESGASVCGDLTRARRAEDPATVRRKRRDPDHQR